MKSFLLRLKRFCGVLCGITFFISGILKLMDPVGASLVMKEYYDFLHISFMAPTAKFIGVGFALSEALVGAALITGVWRRIVAYIACGMQGFFTILTLFLVIFNPKMDCGCFGEVIHLTHLETFLKNIVLCCLLAAYTFPVRTLGTAKTKNIISFSIVGVSVFCFTIYSWLYIPLVDFTDFKPSTILLNSVDSDETGGAQYEATFIYEKDGQREGFDLENLPDSSWTFISTETINKSKHNSGPVLSIYNSNGEYFDHLITDGQVMVISIYDTDLKQKKWNEILDFIEECEKEGYSALVLTPESNIDSITKKMGLIDKETLSSHLYFSDYKTLITLNRSNGGVTYFYDGHLVCKWADIERPDSTELKGIKDLDKTEVMADYDTKGSLTLQGFLLYIFAVMLLL